MVVNFLKLLLIDLWIYFSLFKVVAGHTAKNIELSFTYRGKTQLW